MFDRLLYLFRKGQLTEEQLDVAVSKTWITEEEKIFIISNK